MYAGGLMSSTVKVGDRVTFCRKTPRGSIEQFAADVLAIGPSLDAGEPTVAVKIVPSERSIKGFVAHKSNAGGHAERWWE
jgi:hypothetical protein